MRFGVHIGTGGGHEKAAEYAVEIGAECVQIFAKSPMQWRGPARDVAACAAFADALDAAGIRPLFTHCAYLLNLAGPDEVLRARSIAALADEVLRAEAYRAAGVVTHVGTAPDGDEQAAAARLADSLASARDAAGCAVPVLLEDSPGAGALFGATLEQLAMTIERLPEAAGDVRVCVDTCHAHAAGIDLRSPQAWTAALDRFDELIGLDRLRLIHANDCTGELGGRRDRHAWIGDGMVGEAGFRAMVCEPRLRDVPAICEMPGEVPDKDVENLRRLTRLRESCAGP